MYKIREVKVYYKFENDFNKDRFFNLLEEDGFHISSGDPRGLTNEVCSITQDGIKIHVTGKEYLGDLRGFWLVVDTVFEDFESIKKQRAAFKAITKVSEKISKILEVYKKNYIPQQ